MGMQPASRFTTSIFIVMHMAKLSQVPGMFYRRDFISLVSSITLLLATMACSHAQVPPERSITYVYELSVDKSQEVCSHMGEVLNGRFRNLWDVKEGFRYEDLTPGSDYMFEKVAGVEENAVFVSNMVSSKLPSSPEFAAIQWRETRVTTGEPPGVPLPESHTRRPALIAYADVDNDGQADTLLRYGFTDGFRAMRTGRLGHEYLLVWRSKRLELPVGSSLWELQNDSSKVSQPLWHNGSYIRLFSYMGQTYLLQYEMQLDLETPNVRFFPIRSETLQIMTLSDKGQKSLFGRHSIWTTTMVCEYQMKQIQRKSTNR